jgi:UDP-3-O-[3-hydroxymyristoyl] glucosamine N-acyltransferase
LAFCDAAGPLPGRIQAGVVFVGPKTAIESGPAGPVLIRVDRPKAAFARAMDRLAEERTGPWGPERIDPSARIEAGALIGPGAAIGADAQIGAGARIEANAVIGPGVAIGRHTRIGAGSVIRCALIGDHVAIGPGVFIGQPGFGVIQDGDRLIDAPHVGRVIIQDRASIGAACAIDRGMLTDTLISEEVKLDNFCHIAHNVQVGRQVRMAAFAGISGSTTIGDRALLAGRVGVVDHRRIGKDVVLAACAAVLNDVPDGAFWGGFPAKPRMQWLREMAWLAKAARGRGAKNTED